MTPIEVELLTAFELHSVEGIRAVLDAGFDPRSPLKGKPWIHCLAEMYSRSDRFPGCLRLLLDRGAVLDDPVVAPVLLDDADVLAAMIRADAAMLEHRSGRVLELGGMTLEKPATKQVRPHTL